jgi:hypothetical protein
MGERAGVLATLREPAPAEASRWHKARKSPARARLDLLINFLLEDQHVRLVKRTPTAADLVVDAGEGRTFRLGFRDEEVFVSVGPSVVATEARASHETYLDCVCSFVDVIQLATGFYVHSDELLGFEPIGACPSCDLEVYEWQEQCEICSTKLHPVPAGEDEHDGRARRVVDALLRRKMIEIVSPRGRRNVEKTVSAFYEFGTAGPQVLLDIFVEMADLAEVYCDAIELKRVLCRIQ